MVTDDEKPTSRKSKRYIIASGLALAIGAATVLAVTIVLTDEESGDDDYEDAASQVEVQEDDVPPVPEECVMDVLPLLEGTNMSITTSVDPDGEYVAGRTYPEFQESFAEYRVVVWHNDDIIEVEVPGSDQSMKAINRHGDGIGTTYLNDEAVSFTYIDGDVSVFEDDPDIQLWDINDDGVIVGERGESDGNYSGVPLVWYSNDSDPVELKLPDDSTHGIARAVSDNGMIVGTVALSKDWSNAIPYMWDAQGNGMPLSMEGALPDSWVAIEGVAGNWAYGTLREPLEEVDNNDDDQLDHRVSFAKWNLESHDIEVDDKTFGDYLNQHGWIAGGGILGTEPYLLVDGEKVTLPGFDLNIDLDDEFPEYHHGPNGMSDNNIVGTADSDPESDERSLRGVVWTCD